MSVKLLGERGENLNIKVLKKKKDSLSEYEVIRNAGWHLRKVSNLLNHTHRNSKKKKKTTNA